MDSEGELDADAAAMAAAMGFSSFGGQNHPSKRRKYNPRADDAVVAGDASSSTSSTLPLHSAAAAGSGSNKTPLGQRRPNKEEKKNANEIDLDDDNDEDGEDEGNAATGDDARDPAPQYIDTSQPPDRIQSEIDAIVGGGLPTSAWATPVTHGEVPPPLSGLGHHHHSHHGGGRGGQGGSRDTGKSSWWDDYYDPAFNTNPWEKLEKAQGLEPRGTWLSYAESKAQWATITSQSSSSSSSTTTAAAAAAEAIAQNA